MTLLEYFSLIQEKIKNKDFTSLEIKHKPNGELSVFLEAIHYMMWEWCDDHKDSRVEIFDYILIPNNSDYDFTSVSFDDFLKFLASEKSKKIETITL